MNVVVINCVGGEFRFKVHHVQLHLNAYQCINVIRAFDFGGQSNGGDFVVTGTIGQHDTNKASTGGDFTLSGGFWVAKTTVNQPEIIFTNGFES